MTATCSATLPLVTRMFLLGQEEGHERHQQPDAVEDSGETNETQHHAEVDGITREAIGPCVDDGRGGHIGGYVRAGPSDGGDRPSKQRECQHKHCTEPNTSMLYLPCRNRFQLGFLTLGEKC